MFALAFPRCVSLEPKQELDRRRSARPPGCPTAVRHLITVQCPLTRDTWASPAPQRKCAPSSAPTQAPGQQGPATWHGQGHRPLGQAALSHAEAGASGDATPSLSSPAGPLRQKVWSLALQTLQSHRQFLRCFPTSGTTPRPLSEPLPTLPSWPNLLLCMLVPSLLPACQEPQKTCSGGGSGGGGPSGPTTSSSSAAPGRRELKSARKRQRGGVGLRGGGGTGLKLLFLANGDLFFLLPGGWTWPSWLQGLLRFEVARF